MYKRQTQRVTLWSRPLRATATASPAPKSTPTRPICCLLYTSTAAGSKNNSAVRAMLADFLKDAKVVDGKVTSKENGETITLGAKVERCV